MANKPRQQHAAPQQLQDSTCSQQLQQRHSCKQAQQVQMQCVFKQQQPGGE
jgi:hypothetical protein